MRKIPISVRLQRAGILLAVVVTGAALGIAPTRATSFANEIEPGIYRLDGIDDMLPHDDLAPLAEIIGSAELVGLGEAVRTTKGFYRAKVRLFKYLVEEEGFRSMGFESSWIAAEKAAEYVASCKGPAFKATDSLFSVWVSDSVRDLLTWMCRWNRRNPDDPVYFYGFDIQGQRLQDAAGLNSFLRKIGRDSAATSLELGQCSKGNTPTAEQYERCIAMLDSIWKMFKRNKKSIIKQTSVEELGWARIHHVGLRAGVTQDYYQPRDFERGFNARDVGMAYVAEHIRRLRFPEARTAIWAHNAHISRQNWGGLRVMGRHLKKAFKRDYKTIALVAYEAETEWPWVNCGAYETATEGSVEWFLRELGEPYLLVDLSFPDAKPPYFKKGRKYDHNWGVVVVPRKLYHGVVYMEFAPRMEPLLWEPCQP